MRTATKPKVGHVWQYCDEGFNNGLPYTATWLLLENRDKDMATLSLHRLYEDWLKQPGEVWKVYHLEDNIIRPVCVLDTLSPGWKRIG